ncbi:MAG: hypothetical protein GF331_21975, partial [Chitinivibrionales bacterium]|nr:hypothetical protein [Chitinivibrionales bacterium]
MHRKGTGPRRAVCRRQPGGGQNRFHRGRAEIPRHGLRPRVPRRLRSGTGRGAAARRYPRAGGRVTPRRVICIDIGSTWTKGALFELGAPPRVLATHHIPTTQQDLYVGYRTVRQALDPAERTEILVTSSAKGGLSVAAIGIVPELTLQAAKLTAMSAGAKVVRHYAWKLTAGDIADLERAAPDIVLFTGGTDGGNESYNPANAQAVAASSLAAPIVYAGNRSLADRIRTILADRDVIVAGNVMPAINRLDPEPARAAIRKIFLERIIEGKGLDRIARETAQPIKPTPLAVFALVEALAAADPGHSFC